MGLSRGRNVLARRYTRQSTNESETCRRARRGYGEFDSLHLISLKLFLYKDDHFLSPSDYLLLFTRVCPPNTPSSTPKTYVVLPDSMSSDLTLKILFPVLVEVGLSSVISVVRVGAGIVEDGQRKVDHAVG